MKIEPSFGKKQITFLIVTGLVALAAINFFNWLFLQSLKNDLTGELKKHIENIGQISARLINGSDMEKIYPGMENSPLVLYYQNLLYDLKIRNDLENIVILDPMGHLLLDFRLNYVIGDSMRSFPLRNDLLNGTIIGENPEPVLSRVSDQYFLSAYSPILNDIGETVAVLVIDAPFTFFSTLRQFEKGTIYLGIGGLVILLVFSGITVLATQKLFRAQDRIRDQEHLAQLGQMAASVAHEIRNPLSIMKGTADVLRKKYADISDEMFNYIPDEIERLNRLVNDFLQFARQRTITPEPVDLNDLLGELANQIGDPRVHIQTQSRLPHVTAERSALKQILLNLIQNSLDAVDKDGIVEVSPDNTAAHGKRLTLRVTDNGKGIPAEDLERVFEPFYSTRASGSGLGLAICKQLTEQFGAELYLESRVSHGTTAFLILKTADITTSLDKRQQENGKTFVG